MDFRKKYQLELGSTVESIHLMEFLVYSRYYIVAFIRIVTA